jgi:acyl-CoA synthetase (AMP-forming)/AMP-acid ligase II
MKTVFDAFSAAAREWPENAFLAVLPETAAAYGIAPGEITYAQALARIEALAAGYRAAGWGAGVPAVIGPEEVPPLAPGAEGDGAECALLYTSGTTGLPKGCILSQTYFLEAGRWYHRMGGVCALRPGVERMLTPLPLFHMNAMAVSVMAMVLGGGCLVVLDRFHPATWWDSVAAARATCVHYLGVMPAILMTAPVHPKERAHAVRFGFGAGVDRTLHAGAEARFGFPLVEGWAMTETGAGATIQANIEPRVIGQSCFGRTDDFVEALVVRDDGGECAAEEVGELLVRHRGDDPRYGFFSGYLKDFEATEAGWAGGWWHSGDLVRRDAEGRLYFVDRKKNMIRRSGENIAAVEVEAVLLRHADVLAVGVAAVPDALRGDEVFVCVVPKAKVADRGAFAASLAAWCLERLAYYKAPGYVAVVDALPLTGTNKIQRGQLKELARRLLDDAATVDTRGMKKRQA